jgi:uncharacterized Zn finger protein (UPF0148 family)
MTGGLSLLGAKYGAWHCPFCGSPVRRLRKAGTSATSRSADRRLKKWEQKEADKNRARVKAFKAERQANRGRCSARSTAIARLTLIRANPPLPVGA